MHVRTHMNEYHICTQGSWLFGLKDWIDRKWMAGYSSSLPLMMEKMMRAMAEGKSPAASALEQQQLTQLASSAGGDALDVLSHASMRCGGCGSKVGASVLSRVMARLQQEGRVPVREEVLVGLDAPDDCAVVALGKRRHRGGNSASKSESDRKEIEGQGNEKDERDSHDEDLVSVQTVDYFRSFIADPYIFGQIAANHALSDVHAMCAEAVTAMAIAVVPHSAEKQQEDTLYRMMAGACKVLKDSNCALVGGHTSEGHELSLGFAVTGVADMSKVIRKGSRGERKATDVDANDEKNRHGNGSGSDGAMHEGDVLILTKPIGTGTLFAAEMRLKATGGWVSEALQSMTQSNRQAGMILQSFGAASCTDVTGFGLLGHLVEICQAGKVGMQLDVNQIPLLKGAVSCVENGVFSSLQPSNIRLRRSIINQNQHSLRSHPVYPLLFDPQTAGGLLACVPARQAEACIAALHRSGYPKAAVIGGVLTESSPSASPSSFPSSKFLDGWVWCNHADASTGAAADDGEAVYDEYDFDDNSFASRLGFPNNKYARREEMKPRPTVTAPSRSSKNKHKNESDGEGWRERLQGWVQDNTVCKRR